MDKSITIYLAGPLFGLADKVHNAKLASYLKGFGYSIWLPQNISQMFNLKEGVDIFDICRHCRDMANSCDVLIANLDGADTDSGTAMEFGIALNSRKHTFVIGTRTDFRTDFSNEIGINGMFLLADAIIYYPASVFDSPYTIKEKEFYTHLASSIDTLIVDEWEKRKSGKSSKEERDLNHKADIYFVVGDKRDKVKPEDNSNSDDMTSDNDQPIDNEPIDNAGAVELGFSNIKWDDVNQDDVNQDDVNQDDVNQEESGDNLGRRNNV